MRRSVDVACSNGLSVEEYVYQFPKNMKILSIPENMAVANDFLAYKASYRLKGNTLTVKRAFDNKTRGNVCSPEIDSATKKFASKVLPNVKAQVVYK